MFCLGMVSTNLFMFFYVGGIHNSNCAGKDKVFFLKSGLRLARSADKDIALQCPYR